MKAADLSNSRSRLARAHRCILEAQLAAQSFLASDFHRLRADLNEQDRCLRVSFDLLKSPDRSLDLAVLDAVANLKGALDYLAVSLVRPFGRAPKDILFPVADDAGSLDKEARGENRFGACPKKLQDFIIEKVQPYRNGKGHMLWLVNRLFDTAQHRFLATAVRLNAVAISFEADKTAIEDLWIGNASIKNDATFLVPFPKGRLVREPRGLFVVALAESVYPEGKSVTLFLEEAAQQIQHLIDVLQSMTATQPM